MYQQIASHGKLKPILALNKFLNNFDWGYKINGINVEQTDDFKNYKVLTTKKFFKDKCGVCWDYVNFESDFFAKGFGFKSTLSDLNENEFSCYYVEAKDGSNHTWLAFKLNDIYVFESSWKPFTGLHKFSSEQEMIIAYSNLFRFNNDVVYDKITTYKYERFFCDGMIPITFMDTIISTGKKVYEN